MTNPELLFNTLVALPHGHGSFSSIIFRSVVQHTVGTQDFIAFCFYGRTLVICAKLLCPISSGLQEWGLFYPEHSGIQLISPIDKQNPRGWNVTCTLGKRDFCQATDGKLFGAALTNTKFIVTLFRDVTNSFIPLVGKAQILQMPLNHKTKRNSQRTESIPCPIQAILLGWDLVQLLQKGGGGKVSPKRENPRFFWAVSWFITSSPSSEPCLMSPYLKFLLLRLKYTIKRE